MSACLAGAAAAALVGLAVLAPAPAHAAVTVEGESPAQTNIPVAMDPRASGGRYLALATPAPPPPGGWFATYRVVVPAGGVYRLEAVVTSPAMADRSPKGGSWFDLSVNGARYWEVSKSEPDWADPLRTPAAWGSLVRANLGDVELRKGVNTITFRVQEPRVSVSPIEYRLLLDAFRLSPTRLALTRAYLGDPASNLGVYRAPRATLHFALNGHARRAQRVPYRVIDYFGREVAGGTVRIGAGADGGAVRLPRLAPGNYRIVGVLRSAPATKFTGFFARLPARLPVGGSANRFAVTISAPWLLPPSRVAAFAAAMRDAGVGYVRDEADPNVIEPARGRLLAGAIGRFAQAFRADGVKTLDALWTLGGNLHAPDWSRSPSSGALPADLRDAYDLTAGLAAQPTATRADALEVWNEPDIDVVAGRLSRTPPDRHAAYVKAAALGITDQVERPLASLSGLAGTGLFQDVMLQNGVGNYADVWAFHAYGYAFSGVGSPVRNPPDAEANARLERLHHYHGQTWMTESGIFLKATRGGLNRAQQLAQARYLVQSTVSDLAAGVDKLFWFSGPPYCAAGFACLGLFDGGFQPWPAYSAEAAMTSILGRADFAHPISGLPRSVHAYVFRDRARAVTVVWADAPTRVRVAVPGGNLRLYDVMGSQRSTPGRTGRTLRVAASPDPVYLVSDSGARLKARPTANDARPTVARLSPAEHIVLDQRFAPAATPRPNPFGYRLGDRTAMSLDVYNFNSVPETVTVVPHTTGGWSVTPAQQTVTVPPRGRVGLTFAVAADAAVHRKAGYPLAFHATMAGQTVPPSVSCIVLNKGRRVSRVTDGY